MKNTFVLGLLIVAAVLGLCIHGVITETGLVGWLNALQQSMFGGYWMKLSALLSMAAFALVGAALYFGVSAVLGGSGPALSLPETPSPGQPAPSARAVVWVFGGAIALVWAIGLGLYAWSQHQDGSDARASYLPLVLEGGGRLPDPLADHLALNGRALLDRVVVHSRSKSGAANEEYRLVPLAPPDWQPGQAVSFVAKVRSETEIAGRPRWQPPPRLGAARQAAERAPLLVRLDGSVPLPAAQALKEIGVPLASRAWLVHVVPSVNGRPDIRDESQQEWTLMLTFCGVISGVLLLMGVITTFRARSSETSATRAGI